MIIQLVSTLSLLIVNCQLSLGKSPILIVPGLISSQLEAKVSNNGIFCDTFGYYMSYWISLRLPSCYASVLRLQYDAATNRYSDAEGVSIRVPYFGETDGVEFLNKFRIIPMFKFFVSYFVLRGYQRDRTIRAAPYDWRLAADEHEREGYFRKLQHLIEEMYQDGGQEKVTIVAHSMGGPMTLYFLNNIVSQSWKDKYINAFVPLSAAWSGGHLSLPTLLTGINSIVPDVPILGDYLRKLSSSIQSFESIVWLLPNPQVTQDQVLVSTDTKEYSANDYKELFTDANVPEYYDKLEHVLQINGDFQPPNVPTYCFFGVGLPTVESFHYGSDFGTLTDIDFGDGDGVVNRISSEVCLRWSTQDAHFESKEFKFAGHITMLSNLAILNEIAEIVGL